VPCALHQWVNGSDEDLRSHLRRRGVHYSSRTNAAPMARGTWLTASAAAPEAFSTRSIQQRELARADTLQPGFHRPTVSLFWARSGRHRNVCPFVPDAGPVPECAGVHPRRRSAACPTRFLCDQAYEQGRSKYVRSPKPPHRHSISGPKWGRALRPMTGQGLGATDSQYDLWLLIKVLTGNSGE
jgi:hypothetical protein